MRIPIPRSVYERASQETRGSRQMDVIQAYLSPLLISGEELIGYDRVTSLDKDGNEIPCEVCGGSGLLPAIGIKPPICPRCLGKGKETDLIAVTAGLKLANPDIPPQYQTPRKVS